MTHANLKIKRRTFILLALFSILTVALILRVGYLQIVRGEELQKMAYKDQTLDREINPRRGIIFDRNGKRLAISASVETISVNPQDLKEQHTDAEIKTIAAGIAVILDMTEDEVYTKLTRNNRFEYVKQKVDKEIGTRVREYLVKNNITSVYVDEDAKRFYPNGNLASHVIGFTTVDNQGLQGVEKVMDQYLRGVPGKILSEVDARGKAVPFNQERYIDSKDGMNVVLTIDETIQHFTEKALEKAILDNNLKMGAAGIVMDPKTGEILAMSSKPDFDLNAPWGQPENLEWSNWTGRTQEEVNILSKTVWRNKALQDTYEPGSTFKAFTAAAALEEGVVNLDTPVVCKTVSLGGYNINCWQSGGHGAETFRMGVYNSCNPVFVQVGLNLGIDRFYKYFESFGFKEKTGLNLPGEAAPIPHKNPTEIDLAVSSFGQRFQITPLQLITGYTAIANGGKLMKPILVKEITDADGNIIEKFEPEVVRKVISQQTSDTLREVLEGVVAEGTGRNAYVPGYRVAGKTGTSETLQTDTEGRYIASFMAFAPADDPQICVLVVLDFPQGNSYYGGSIAAPVAGGLVEDILNYMDIERDYTEIDKKLMFKEVYVPEVREMTFAEAKQRLKDANLNYSVEGEGVTDETIIREQTPKPDASIPEKSTVILYSYEPEEEIYVEMPYILNKTINEAAETLEKHGLNIKVQGMGVVHDQEYEEGTLLPKGKVINVKFVVTETD